jgi:hypothetical protein
VDGGKLPVHDHVAYVPYALVSSELQTKKQVWFIDIKFSHLDV